MMTKEIQNSNNTNTTKQIQISKSKRFEIGILDLFWIL
jgi:hypothetical protein